VVVAVATVAVGTPAATVAGGATVNEAGATVDGDEDVA
jgi:hypothetical protein